MDDLSLPTIVSYKWIAIVLIATLAIFHVTLVWLRPLGKIGWKKVDYIWLTCALLGVIGGIGSARQVLAAGRLSLAESRIETEAKWLLDRVASGRSDAVCRQFVRSEFSPPEAEFSRLQREFDALCAWFKQAASRAPSQLAQRSTIAMEDLGDGSPPTGADRWYVEALQDQVDRYNMALTARERLGADAQPLNVEVTLAIFGPYLLAVAIALRITKVSGEINLERDGAGRPV